MNAEKRQKLEEMKAICRPPGKAAGLSASERIIYKPIGFAFTRLFVKTNITPNQVTGIWGLLLVFASLMFLLNCPWLSVLAAVLWIIGLSLDFTDGDIARYKNIRSKRGTFLDMINHSLTFPLVFICIGLSVYFLYGNVISVVLGAIAGFSMVLIMYLPLIFNVANPESQIQMGRSHVVEGKLFKRVETFQRVMDWNPLGFMNVFIILLPITIINVFFTSGIDLFGWFEISILGLFLLFYGVSYFAATMGRIVIMYRGMA